MLDKLEMARRRYEEIQPDLGSKITEYGAEQLAIWLKKNVCPIVALLASRPDFQTHAKWPIERLGGQILCEERSLVSSVDSALVACASALAAFAKQPDVYQQLLRLGPYNNGPLAEGNTQGQDPIASKEQGKPIPLGVSTMDIITSRPWRDLVSIYDYFRPVSNLNLINPPRNEAGQLLSDGSFLPFIRPSLRVPGDYISRCMWIRIENWRTLLQIFWVRCHTALQWCPHGGGKSWDVVAQARATLDERSEALKIMCFEDSKAGLRDSCIALLQIFAAYQPKADLKWLGLPPDFIRANANVLPFHVQHQGGTTITERVAAALLDVSDRYRQRVEPNEIIQQACRSHALVLVCGVGVQTIVWKSKNVKYDWTSNRALWEFLVVLTERALEGLAVDSHLWRHRKYDKKPAPLKDCKHRLKNRKILPQDLFEKIKPAGRGSYKLDLRPEEICLLQYSEDEQIVPYRPTSRPTASLETLIAEQ